jgi:hypothetical protein
MSVEFVAEAESLTEIVIVMETFLIVREYVVEIQSMTSVACVVATE